MLYCTFYLSYNTHNLEHFFLYKKVRILLYRFVFKNYFKFSVKSKPSYPLDYICCFSRSLVFTLSPLENARFSYYLSNKSLKRFVLYKTTQVPTTLPYLIDAGQAINSELINIYYSFSTLIGDNGEMVITSLNNLQKEILSLSDVFHSASWLERELSDFTGIYFINLIDSRSLLLDYLTVKQPQTTHNTNTCIYDNVIYEVTPSY